MIEIYNIFYKNRNNLSVDIGILRNNTNVNMDVGAIILKYL